MFLDFFGITKNSYIMAAMIHIPTLDDLVATNEG
jgi:hypothetical protein